MGFNSIIYSQYTFIGLCIYSSNSEKVYSLSDRWTAASVCYFKFDNCLYESASIIFSFLSSQYFIVTAAHCLAPRRNGRPDNFTIVAGDHDTRKEEGFEQVMNALEKYKSSFESSRHAYT